MDYIIAAVLTILFLVYGEYCRYQGWKRAMHLRANASNKAFLQTLETTEEIMAEVGIPQNQISYFKDLMKKKVLDKQAELLKMLKEKYGKISTK